MSTLSFLPYITEHFSKEYIIPNYFGESLSSLVPGVLSMIQSFHRPEKPCKKASESFNNGTNNSAVVNSTSSKFLYNANYSVSLYFGLLFVLILSSVISFTWLHFSKIAIKSRKSKDRHDSLLEMSNMDGENEYQHHHHDISVNINMDKKKDVKEKFILISLAFIVTFINYGFLPGLYSVSNFYFD